ncbi:MAG: hypothetical protein HETSPECPRED_006339 [Heterodermia speciosa]|uniref:Uncharacterized protein n=1 Tax=Heterodermia speciosa TaxID=116794 RepID=A0A8H3FN95_9LECA|nr:MAG: hypothetical protein HETSPECPRED_006339 [Heterodermia speciosa]
MFEDQASVLGQPKRNSWPQSSAHRTAQGQSPTVTEPDEPQLSRGSFDQQYAPHGNFSYANQYPGQQFYGTSPHQGHFATPSSHNQNGGYANQSHQLSQSLPQSSALAHFQTQSAPQAMPNNTQVANFFPATKPQPVVPGQASAAPRIDSSLFGADYVSDTTETFYLREQPIRPQPEDGKIRSPAMNGGEFHDAFKCDWHGKENHTLAVTIKDLPSKDAKCSVKSRASDNQGLPQVKVPQDLTLQPLPQGYWAALIALLCAHTGVWPLHARLTGTP